MIPLEPWLGSPISSIFIRRINFLAATSHRQLLFQHPSPKWTSDRFRRKALSLTRIFKIFMPALVNIGKHATAHLMEWSDTQKLNRVQVSLFHLKMDLSSLMHRLKIFWHGFAVWSWNWRRYWTSTSRWRARAMSATGKATRPVIGKPYRRWCLPWSASLTWSGRN